MRKAISLIFFILLYANAHCLNVLLASDIDEANIYSDGLVTIEYFINNTKSKQTLYSPALDIVAGEDQQIYINDLPYGKRVSINANENSFLTFNNNKYSGKIDVIFNNNSIILVEETDIENYLYGVLPNEMHYKWHKEALKAQAITARTYLYRIKTAETPIKAQDPNKKYFDVYADVRDQVYTGSADILPSVKEAVDATAGLILTYNNKPFFTFYHSSCGAIGTDILPWESEDKNISPLQGAKCNYCTVSKYHNWENKVTNEQLDQYFKKNGLSGPVEKIEIKKRAKHGHVITLRFKLDKKHDISAHDFRMEHLSLIKSTNITSISKSADGFIFKGVGYGHGTGMCQVGAKVMGEEGYSYKEILSHYYPRSTIKNVKDLLF